MKKNIICAFRFAGMLYTIRDSPTSARQKTLSPKCGSDFIESTPLPSSHVENFTGGIPAGLSRIDLFDRKDAGFLFVGKNFFRAYERRADANRKCIEGSSPSGERSFINFCPLWRSDSLHVKPRSVGPSLKLTLFPSTFTAGNCIMCGSVKSI